MEKATFTKIVNDLKAAGMEAYLCYCRGGNYEIRHNNKDTFLIPCVDYVIHLTYHDTHVLSHPNRGTQFEINMVPYDNIDYVMPIGPNFKETVALMKATGAPQEVMDFISGGGARTDISIASRAGTYNDPLKDDFETPKMPEHQSAYIVENEPVIK